VMGERIYSFRAPHVVPQQSISKADPFPVTTRSLAVPRTSNPRGRENKQRRSRPRARSLAHPGRAPAASRAAGTATADPRSTRVISDNISDDHISDGRPDRPEGGGLEVAAPYSESTAAYVSDDYISDDYILRIDGRLCQ
jgi:hypothetical protein